MLKLKYRKNEFFERPAVPEFSEYEDELEYDEENDTLVVVGRINCQERIQSSADCALNKILDKYLPEQIVQSLKDKNPIGVDNEHVFERAPAPDLADLGAEYERLEELKEKYNLDPALDYDKVLPELRKRKVNLDNFIHEAEEASKKSVNVKESKKDEKTQNEISQE